MTMVLEALRNLVTRSHEAQMTELSVADTAQMNQRIQSMIARQEGMAKHQYEKCNPDYDPVKDGDDVGDVNIISGNVIADENALQSLIMSQKGSKDSGDGTVDAEDRPPKPEKPAIDKGRDGMGDRSGKRRFPDWMKVVAAVGAMGAGGLLYDLLFPRVTDLGGTPVLVETQFDERIEVDRNAREHTR